MTLTLVKTTGGTNGTPTTCKGCNSSHFVKVGIAWHCSNCGTYFPAKLSQTVTAESIRKDFKDLDYLHRSLKDAIRTLEKLVKE
jgi:ribosomal protein L37AE/L43A